MTYDILIVVVQITWVGDKSYFVTLDQNVKTHITLGDGKKENVAEKGIIVVKTKDGSSKLIHEVNNVPGLAQNLLSVGQLIKKGYMVKFENNKCQIYNKNKDQIITTFEMAPNKKFPLKMSKKKWP